MRSFFILPVGIGALFALATGCSANESDWVRLLSDGSFPT
jgi:hypothetical protein